MLPKGMELPNKIDLDWNLIKAGDNFCSKIGNNGTLHWYGHEIMVSMGAYKSWVNEYNKLKDDQIWDAGSSLGKWSREKLFFAALYSENRARLILNGAGPGDASSKASKYKKMLYFTAEFKGVDDIILPGKFARIEPFESMRGKEFTPIHLSFEHQVGSATVAVDGICHVFDLPNELGGCEGGILHLYSSLGNVRAEFQLEPL